MKLSVVFAAGALALNGSVARAQTPSPYQSIDGIMTELYASVTRLPGQPFPWDRMRAIMFPGAVMLPQPRQNMTNRNVMSVEEFIAWIDAAFKGVIGTSRDQGFYERQTNLVVDQYGDIAQGVLDL